MPPRMSERDLHRLASRPGVRARHSDGRLLDSCELARTLKSMAPRRRGDERMQAVLAAIVGYGFPTVSLEHEHRVDTRPGERGGAFRLDLAIPELKVAIEADGWAYHGRFPKAFASHTRRQNALVIRGWHPLRYTRAMIRHPEAVVSEIQGLLSRLSNACIPGYVAGHCGVCARRWDRVIGRPGGPVHAVPGGQFIQSHPAQCACGVEFSHGWVEFDPFESNGTVSDNPYRKSAT